MSLGHEALPRSHMVDAPVPRAGVCAAAGREETRVSELWQSKILQAGERQQYREAPGCCETPGILGRPLLFCTLGCIAKPSFEKADFHRQLTACLFYCTTLGGQEGDRGGEGGSCLLLPLPPSSLAESQLTASPDVNASALLNRMAALDTNNNAPGKTLPVVVGRLMTLLAWLGCSISPASRSTQNPSLIAPSEVWSFNPALKVICC